MFTAATIQYKPEKGNPSNNRSILLRMCEQAVRKRARLLILPEMCLTGYVWLNRTYLYSLSEPAQGHTFEIFSAFCRKNGCFLTYGFAEQDRGSLFNAQNLIGPDGNLLATYRKTHLYDLDYFWAHEGDRGYLVVDTHLGKMGLGICMDLNFDDFMKFHLEEETDWLLFSTNWLEEGEDSQKYWKVRLAAFQGTAFLANSYGYEGPIEFCGYSCIYHQGQFISSAPRHGNHILLTQHDLTGKIAV